jgi:hypothetical protein
MFHIRAPGGAQGTGCENMQGIAFSGRNPVLSCGSRVPFRTLPLRRELSEALAPFGRHVPKACVNAAELMRPEPKPAADDYFAQQLLRGCPIVVGPARNPVTSNGCGGSDRRLGCTLCCTVPGLVRSPLSSGGSRRVRGAGGSFGCRGGASDSEPITPALSPRRGGRGVIGRGTTASSGSGSDASASSVR